MCIHYYTNRKIAQHCYSKISYPKLDLPIYASMYWKPVWLKLVIIVNMPHIVGTLRINQCTCTYMIVNSNYSCLQLLKYKPRKHIVFFVVYAPFWAYSLLVWSGAKNTSQCSCIWEKKPLLLDTAGAIAVFLPRHHCMVFLSQSFQHCSVSQHTPWSMQLSLCKYVELCAHVTESCNGLLTRISKLIRRKEAASSALLRWSCIRFNSLFSWRRDKAIPCTQ